ncbi:DUF6266 family protein [Pedobacter sp. HMWF019]|uniref:DUF6266 family protein n=1 Tax=Pedobacter sp. HMWF019 TaxID=2056856 RepID=UPI0011B255E9|nr:DUF6266 family protein [Pedobacter sp. HMWF019]
MAKISKGILGAFSGKVGPVVGSNWRSIAYIKASPRKANKKSKRSAAQIANQQKFRFVSEWLVPFHPYVSIGFLNLSNVKSEINLAFSENFHRAVVGEYPNLDVDYSKVVLSQGQLGGLICPEMELIESDTLYISWSTHMNQRVDFDDQVMLVVYCPELGIADGFVGGAKRADKECMFKFNQKMIGKALEVYVSVTSFNRKKIANSIYLGRIES